MKLELEQLEDIKRTINWLLENGSFIDLETSYNIAMNSVNTIDEAINYSHCCKSDSEPLIGHWTDDWEKAEYKIRKFTNDNGYVNYKAYRTLNDKTELASLSNKFGYKTEKEALKAVEDCKAFHRENWNKHYTNKEEWINVY